MLGYAIVRKNFCKTGANGKMYLFISSIVVPHRWFLLTFTGA